MLTKNARKRFLNFGTSVLQANILTTDQLQSNLSSGNPRDRQCFPTYPGFTGKKVSYLGRHEEAMIFFFPSYPGFQTSPT